jgi:photosystem II stability/assembly factor-like uncharacterized protein
MMNLIKRFPGPVRSLSLFAGLLVSTSLIAQDWLIVKAFQPAQTLHSIKFANDSVGYTVSSLYGGSTNNIHKTTDGGETWIDQSSGHSATRFKDIYIVSEDTVFMCGNYGLVIHTFDGGENWISDTVAAEGDHLFGIDFVGHTGYVCGNSGAIYKTTDLGETWAQVDPPFLTAIEEIYLLNEDFGFICGLNFIYYTDDGGNSWKEPLTFPGATTNWWLREFSFVDESTGYVCADIGQVYKTTDGGLNWQWMENTNFEVSLQSMIALDENNLLACGYDGTVIRSVNGGQEWHSMTSASTKNFYSIAFTPSGVGFVCSHSGEVLRYTDPYTLINDHLPEDNFNVFPNPFQDQIMVSCNMSLAGKVTLELFDVNGRLVKHLFKGKKQQGAHTVSIHTEELPQGVYVVKLNLNRSVVERKIVKGF